LEGITAYRDIMDQCDLKYPEICGLMAMLENQQTISGSESHNLPMASIFMNIQCSC